MSRLTLVVIASLLLATVAAAQAVSPAPAAPQTAPPTPSAPQQASDLPTVFLINRNADLGTFEHVSANVTASGRWKIVEKPEDADILLVLSEKKETTMVTFNPNGVFMGVYYLGWPTAIEVDTLTLAVVKRATGRELLTVSCARHRFPSAPRWLVSRVNKKLEIAR